MPGDRVEDEGQQHVRPAEPAAPGHRDRGQDGHERYGDEGHQCGLLDPALALTTQRAAAGFGAGERRGHRGERLLGRVRGLPNRNLRARNHLGFAAASGQGCVQPCCSDVLMAIDKTTPSRTSGSVPVELRREGMSVKQIVAAAGHSPAPTSCRTGSRACRRRRGLAAHAPRTPNGREPGSCAAGLTYDEIATELKVSKSSISLWTRDLPHPERGPMTRALAWRASDATTSSRRCARDCTRSGGEASSGAEAVGQLSAARAAHRRRGRCTGRRGPRTSPGARGDVSSSSTAMPT